VREELRGDDRADRMAAQVLGAGGAAAVAVEPRERVGPAELQFPTEDVAVGHRTGKYPACDRGEPGGGSVGRMSIPPQVAAPTLPCSVMNGGHDAATSGPRHKDPAAAAAPSDGYVSREGAAWLDELWAA
jgi:hypothetical protein